MADYQLREQLTVARLIELLQAMPQDALVDVEGCDCVGEARGVSIADRSGYMGGQPPAVVIER